MDKYERNVFINSKTLLRKDTWAVCTTNSARWSLRSRLRLGATSQLLQFGRGHLSHFYQLCGSGPDLAPHRNIMKMSELLQHNWFMNVISEVIVMKLKYNNIIYIYSVKDIMRRRWLSLKIKYTDLLRKRFVMSKLSICITYLRQRS